MPRPAPIKARLLITVASSAGLLLLGAFGLVAVLMVRNAGRTHQAVTRLSQVDHAVSQLYSLRVELRAVRRLKNEIVRTGQTARLGELEDRIASAGGVLRQVKDAATRNPALQSASVQIGDDVSHCLERLSIFGARLHAMHDPKAMTAFLEQAGADARLNLADTASSNLAAIIKLREETSRFMAAEYRGLETDAFWFLLFNGTLILMTIIGAGGIVVLRIYDRKRAVAERAEAMERISAADVSRSRFLAAASHDLRQPLQAVTLFTTALRRRVGDTYVTSLIDGISSAVTSLERMFNGLLDISKLDAGIVAAERTDFSVARLLHNLDMAFSALAEAKGLRFTVISDNAVVYTDPILLESMVRNIVANAIKYTREGYVIVACRPEGRSMVIDVGDTGAGIAESEHEDIFHEFHRGASSSAGEEGLGLGLAIVRRLSRLLGIGVSVHSIVGVGSTFSLLVPLSIGATPPSAMAEKRAPRPMPETMRVLLLDDDELLRRAIAAELTDHGMEVTALPSANEVMALFQDSAKRTAFDVALIDFNLGDGSNGVALLDRLAVDFGIALPALIMTGETDPEILEELGDSGYAWLQKPVEASVLINALTALVEASDEAAPADLLSALERSTLDSHPPTRAAPGGGNALTIS